MLVFLLEKWETAEKRLRILTEVVQRGGPVIGLVVSYSPLA